MNVLTDLMTSLSVDSRCVVQAAQEEALQIGSSQVTVDHLLISLCVNASPEVGACMQAARVERHDLALAVRTQLAASHQGVENSDELPPLHPEVLYLCEQAVELAASHQDQEARPLHLLLALLEETELQPGTLASNPENVEALTKAANQRLVRRQARLQGNQQANQTPYLKRYTNDLTLQARKGELFPAVGREAETLACVQVLARERKSNLLLLGEPGVGKTSIVEALAFLSTREDAPIPLRGKRILSLMVSGLLGGTSYRGQLEERIEGLLKELEQAQDVILFIDEIHTVLGAGSLSPSSMDLADALKPALARGRMHCIAATTTQEYERHLRHDGAFERRFEILTVEEPTPAQTLEILRAVRLPLEAHHEVRLADSALEAAVYLSGLYVADRRFPDKALDLLDHAAAQVRFPSLHHAVDHELPPLVDADDVALRVSIKTGIPVEGLARCHDDMLAGLGDALAQRVLGQQAAVETLAQSLVAKRRWGAGDKPQGVYLLVGPAGVGKTEMARATAEALFGSERYLVRFDMSEFMHPESLTRLLGTSAGWSQHEMDGQLIRAARSHSHFVLLLDEIDKAHPKVLDVFLQLMETGRLTGGNGQKADFRHATVIMTAHGHHLETRVLPSELLQRVDEVITFRQLGKVEVRSLLEQMLVELQQEGRDRGTQVRLEEGVCDFLLNNCTWQNSGARELRRTVDRLLRRPLAQQMVRSASPGKMCLRVWVEAEVLRYDLGVAS